MESELRTCVPRPPWSDERPQQQPYLDRQNCLSVREEGSEWPTLRRAFLRGRLCESSPAHRQPSLWHIELSGLHCTVKAITHRGTVKEHPHCIQFVELPLHDGTKEERANVTLINGNALLEALVCFQIVGDSQTKTPVEVPGWYWFRKNWHLFFLHHSILTSSQD